MPGACWVAILHKCIHGRVACQAFACMPPLATPSLWVTPRTCCDSQDIRNRNGNQRRLDLARTQCGREAFFLAGMKLSTALVLWSCKLHTVVLCRQSLILSARLSVLQSPLDSPSPKTPAIHLSISAGLLGESCQHHARNSPEAIQKAGRPQMRPLIWQPCTLICSNPQLTMASKALYLNLTPHITS